LEGHRHVDSRYEPSVTSSSRSRITVSDVRVACQAADPDSLRDLLEADVTAVVDGGGNVPAPAGPVTGAADVADYLLGLIGAHPSLLLAEHSVNGRTGIVLSSGERVVGVVSVGIRLDRVSELLIVLNPEKLRAWNLG
jgi:RNA polymerase sigma-70 factor, ECF subfamily